MCCKRLGRACGLATTHPCVAIELWPGSLQTDVAPHAPGTCVRRSVSAWRPHGSVSVTEWAPHRERSEEPVSSGEVMDCAVRTPNKPCGEDMGCGSHAIGRGCHCERQQATRATRSPRETKHCVSSGKVNRPEAIERMEALRNSSRKKASLGSGHIFATPICFADDAKSKCVWAYVELYCCLSEKATSFKTDWRR